MVRDGRSAERRGRNVRKERRGGVERRWKLGGRGGKRLGKMKRVSKVRGNAANDTSPDGSNQSVSKNEIKSTAKEMVGCSLGTF